MSTQLLLARVGDLEVAGQAADRQAGGHTIAQDGATSVVYGMPPEAAARGAALRILALDDVDDIGAAIAAIAGPPGNQS